MQILLVSATINEINPAVEWLKKEDYATVKVLFTGVGGTAAAFTLTKAFSLNRPDLVLQAGIGGSFSPKYPPGSLAFIDEEVIADLGAIEQGHLTDIFDMGFAGSDEKPFSHRMLVNPAIEKYKKYEVNFVRGATVNGISSTPGQISIIAEKYDPVIESMEGAALHYVCLMEDIPFLQLRAVSNFVGERNKANWKIKEALTNLNEKLKVIIKDMANR